MTTAPPVAAGPGESRETAPTAGDRSDLWLPLLRRLTQVLPEWAVWKNVESAFTGTGDIDAAAPERDWPTVQREFVRWAADGALDPVIVCPHIPGGLNLIAAPISSPTLLEMGVKARKIWRGSTLFVLDDLLPLMELDARGFRRIRVGAEGLFKLLLNGMRWDGRPDAEALASKNVIEQLRADPEGVRLAARLLSPAGARVARAAERVAAGGWDRAGLLAAESVALGRALGHPGVALSRLRFRLRAQSECPVVTTLLRDRRRVPPDRDRWLAEVRRTHEVHPRAA